MRILQKLLVAASLLALGCAPSLAQPNFNLYSQTKQVVLLQPTNLAGGTVYSGPVDMRAFGGVVDVVITAISNGVAGDANISIYAATQPTNAAAGWVVISNAVVGNWVPVTTTNLSILGTSGQATNVVNQATEAFTSAAAFTTSSNSMYLVGIPVRDTAQYWRLGVTNGGSSLRALSAVIIGRQMTAN